MIGFDEYTIRARLAPVLVVLLPLFAAFMAWRPTDSMLSSAGIGMVGAVALGGLLSQLGRDLGKRKERSLMAEWGGLPTTKLLRHRTRGANAVTLARRHARLAALMPGTLLPTPQQEQENPAHAETAYQSCVDFLREKTRDKGRFPLIFQENINYGFRRNLWAMKPAGVVVAVGAGAASAGAVWNRASTSSESLTIPIIALVVSVAILVVWIARVRTPWVALAATAYAERLVGACDEL